MASPTDLAIGQTVSLRLSHGDDAITVYGAVRWVREAEGEGSVGYEVGIAFTEVGDQTPESLWRSLTVYRPE